MPQRSLHLELPRRIVVFYLLFCVISVVWLAAGIVLVTQSVLEDRTEGNCLSQLGRTCSALEIEYLRHGGSDLQPLIEKYQRESGLLYSAVESANGRYIAHSLPAMVGEAARIPPGEPLRYGNIEGVRFTDASLRYVREYRAPLRSHDDNFGWLRIGVAEPSFWGTIQDASEYAPWAILGPLCLMGLGAVVMKRMVRPMADIDRQLRVLAVDNQFDSATPHAVPQRGAVALGWNRLVDRLQQQRQQTGIDQRLAEATAVPSQGLGETALASLADGMAITDVDGQISFANPALSALLGCDAAEKEINGRAMLDLLMAGDEEESVETPLLETFDTTTNRRTVVAELQRSTTAGARVLRVARHPLRQGNGAGGHVWSVRDVTQQKLAEKMREQFLDSATHELRTPLANIKAYAETLALNDMLDVDKQKEFCNTINSEATRLARFIDDLLSLSSIEVGAMSVNRQNVDVERLFDEAISKVQPLMDQKDIAFETFFPERLPELSLDKDKLIATLVNLLGNAAKYTPEGGNVSLRVRCTDDQLSVDVEDSGLGIAPDEVSQVFEKFFRSADKRVRSVTGTGLGLSIAREVVRLHGGEMTVESTLDKGSKFSFNLPIGA